MKKPTYRADPYKVLAISRHATPEGIREAYRRECRFHHPDLFAKNSEKWQQANEVMAVINWAHELLSDPQLRSEYDESCKPPPAKNRENPDAPEEGIRNCNARGLTRAGLDMMRSLQESSSENACRISIRSPLERLASVTFGTACVVTPAAIAAAGGFESGYKWLAILLPLLGSWILWEELGALWQSAGALLRSNFYFTPLYFIKTEKDEITYCRLNAIREFKPTHHYVNGSYQRTTVELDLGLAKETVTFRNRKAFDRLIRLLQQWQAAVNSAIESRDLGFFLQHDPFRDAVHSSPRMKAKPSWREPRGWGPLGAVVMVSVLFSTVTLALNEAVRRADLTRYAARQPEADVLLHASGASPLNAAYLHAPVVPPLQPLPLPEDGAFLAYGGAERLAPLTISTAGPLHHFVKIEDWNTKQPVMALFIRAGQTAHVQVPLGSFRLKDAAGETWYGPRLLFGPETACEQASERFNFSVDGDTVRGFTVQLYLQPHGNLSTAAIRLDDF